MQESMKLWRFYLDAGGSLDPEPDSQSPFDAVMPHGTRPWLRSLENTDEKRIEQLLREEEYAQRLADEEYWKPLKAELEQLRLNRHRRL
jgi:hypothetical protein